MTKVKTLFSLAGIFFLTAAILAGSMLTRTNQNVAERAAASTNLYFGPQSQDLFQGENFSFTVNMDTGENSVTGIDISMEFDPTVLQIDSLIMGSGVGALDNTITNSFDNTEGSIIYTIFTIDKSTAVKGDGVEILTINGKVTDDAPIGESLITFDSSSAISATGETQSALVSSSPGAVVVEPAPTSEPTDEPFVPGDPNSCGGTCGSNANCESGLFCHQGYCRNPSCSGESDCNCNTEDPDPTQAPTSNPTQRPLNRIRTSEPVVVELTPEPIFETEDEEPNFWENTVTDTQDTADSPTLEPISLPDQETDDFTPWIIGALIVGGITIIFIAIKLYKDASLPKSHPPVIKL